MAKDLRPMPKPPNRTVQDDFDSTEFWDDYDNDNHWPWVFLGIMLFTLAVIGLIQYLK